MSGSVNKVIIAASIPRQGYCTSYCGAILDPESCFGAKGMSIYSVIQTVGSPAIHAGSGMIDIPALKASPHMMVVGT